MTGMIYNNACIAVSESDKSHRHERRWAFILFDFDAFDAWMRATPLDCVAVFLQMAYHQPETCCRLWASVLSNLPSPLQHADENILDPPIFSSNGAIFYI